VKKVAKKSFKGSGADLFLTDVPTPSPSNNVVKDLKINPEFKSLIPPLNREEYVQLEENILQDGIRESISLWNETIIDGHTRYEIALKHGLPFTTVGYEFASESDVILWIIKNQFGRRNLTAYDRSILALRLKPVIAEQAKINQGVTLPKISWEIKEQEEAEKTRALKLSSEAENARISIAKENASKKHRNYYNAQTTEIYFIRIGDTMSIGCSNNVESRIAQYKASSPNAELLCSIIYGEEARKLANRIKEKFSCYFINGEVYQYSYDIFGEIKKYVIRELERKNETDVILAKIAGVSHDTITKAEKIEKEATPEVKAQLRRGEITINRAYQDIKRQHNKEEAAATATQFKQLEEKYSVIYAAPPWQNDLADISNRAGKHSYSLKVSDIKKMQVPAEDNAVLFMWATAPLLKEALEVMAAWGFKYKTSSVWDKKKAGLDFWFKGQHELLLVGVKGAFKAPEKVYMVSSVHREAEKDQSKKPVYYNEIIERMFPDEKYLEMFSNQPYNDKWAVWSSQQPSAKASGLLI